ncbi:hypothetical protein Tco_0014568 [Tanacetum coccineum]
MAVCPRRRFAIGGGGELPGGELPSGELPGGELPGGGLPNIAAFPAVKGWLDEDLDNYHLKELRCSTQCHTQMSMWIISRGVVLLILLMEYKPTEYEVEHDTSQSKQNLQSYSMTFIHKTLIIPSALDIKICAYDKNFSIIWTYTTMMLPRVRNHHGGKCVHLGLN